MVRDVLLEIDNSSSCLNYAIKVTRIIHGCTTVFNCLQNTMSYLSNLYLVTE